MNNAKPTFIFAQACPCANNLNFIWLNFLPYTEGPQKTQIHQLLTP